jgi:hypothetical protein
MTMRLLAFVACALAVTVLAGSARAQHGSAAAPCLPAFACFDVVVSGDGDGSGTLTTPDGTVDCTFAAGVATGVCSHTYNLAWLPGFTSRVSVNLIFTTTPATGSSSQYASVTGGIGGSVVSVSDSGGAQTVTYRFTATRNGDQAVPIRASFRRRPFTLSVSKSGSGTGTVTSVPAGIDCGSTCAALTYYGDKVTLSATPDAGSRFAGWTGACSGTSATCALTITGIPLVGAIFQSVQTVSVSTSGPGDVKSSPSGIDCGSACIARFDTGTKLTLTATPDSGATFEQWTGACAGQGASCKLTVAAPVSTRAVFESKPKPPSTTTVATTTTQTTTTPPPPPPSASKPGPKLAARLIGVSVLGHGKVRSLRVTLLVSSPARARLRLLQHGFERARKLVGLHAGTNSLRLGLPSSLRAGSYRLEVAIRAGSQHMTTTVLIAVTPPL